MVSHQTSGAEVPDSNPAYPTMILGRSAGSLCNNVKNLRIVGKPPTEAKKKKEHFYFIRIRNIVLLQRF